MRSPSLPIRVAVIGAGNRGRSVFGAYALARPERMRVVALAEPREDRRRAMAEEHGLTPAQTFADARALFAAPSAELDAAIVATGDTEHVAPTTAALARGLHVLLEKPMALDPVDCVRLVEAAERAQRILQIGHVLRYTEFYRRVHEIARSGRLGRLQLLDLREHVAHWHFAHSYVRGKFRNAGLAAPFVLAKSCHDLDLLVWLAGSTPRRLSSFGSRGTYREESAPAGAPARCTDGCPVQADCPHDAVRFYLEPDDRRARHWPYHDLSLDPSREARRAALETGPYGRCVFRCDNDVADHQLVSVELEDGAVASLGVHGTASRELRTIRISGSAGELRGALQDGVIEISRHGSRELERIEIEASPWGHSGGDRGLLDHFTDVVARGARDEVQASGRAALESHVLGFAAELARAESRVVELAPYRAELARAAR